MQEENISYKAAVASTDGIVVNSHFGKADTFYIFQIDDKQITPLEKRSVQPVCRQGDHDEEQLLQNCQTLTDCKYVLVARIGYRAAECLRQLSVIPMELPDLIEAALDKLIAYDQIQHLFDR